MNLHKWFHRWECLGTTWLDSTFVVVERCKVCGEAKVATMLGLPPNQYDNLIKYAKSLGLNWRKG